MPCPNLPQPVFFFECATLNEVLMIRHREQCGEQHNEVRPLSPTLQFLFVPCHRSRWLPGGKPMAVKPPRTSTMSLVE